MKLAVTRLNNPSLCSLAAVLVTVAVLLLALWLPGAASANAPPWAPGNSVFAPGYPSARENCFAVHGRQAEKEITRQALDTDIFLPVTNCQHIWQAIGQIGNQVDNPNHP